MGQQKISVSEAKKEGACKAALKWAGRRRKVSVDEVFKKNPEWAAWAYAHGLCKLSSEQISYIVDVNTWAAARYLRSRLSDEQIASIAARNKLAAEWYFGSLLKKSKKKISRIDEL